jgi:hypothetical protein
MGKRGSVELLVLMLMLMLMLRRLRYLAWRRG